MDENPKTIQEREENEQKTLESGKVSRKRTRRDSQMEENRGEEKVKFFLPTI